MKFPYEIKDLDEKSNEDVSKYFPEKLVEIGPRKFKLFKMYENFAEKYYNFQLRKEDVFVCGFPRSGTTLTEELVWLLCNNLDLERGEKLKQFEKAHFFDIDSTISEETERQIKQQAEGADHQRKFPRFDDFDKLPNPRVFKTHMLSSLMPPDFLTAGCKIVYLARNPKDAIVSNYHFFQRREGVELKADFETFVDLIIQDKLRFAPYWSSIDEFWQHRNSPNVLFLFYEDYIKDLRGTISKIARFLCKDLSDQELNMLEEKMTFQNFRKYFNECHILTKKGDGNDGHVRKGTFGQSQEYFKGELKKKVDKWISYNVKKIGVQFPYLD